MTDRRYFTPESGEVYTNTNGSTYLCLSSASPNNARLMNTVSGWSFDARGCGIYPDGRIDWNYSKNGRFELNEQ